MNICVVKGEKHNDRDSLLLVLGDRIKILLGDL